MINYNMQGMTKMIPELFAMLKSGEGRNQEKSIKCWWLTRPLVSRKRARERKGTLKSNGKQVSTLVKKPKVGPKPETKCFYCKGTGHWKRNCPKYLADKKDGKVNKGIFDIQINDVYFTSVPSNPWLFDTGLVAKISNSKQGVAE